MVTKYVAGKIILKPVFFNLDEILKSFKKFI
jgi:hypothetical protein